MSGTMSGRMKQQGTTGMAIETVTDGNRDRAEIHPDGQSIIPAGQWVLTQTNRPSGTNKRDLADQLENKVA